MQGIVSYIELPGHPTSGGIVLLLIFAGIYLIRFFFDFFMYGRVVFSNDLRIKNSKPSFSVILTVRNEEGNLRDNLPEILTSSYLDFEVIVVDDFSQDQTYTILGLLREKYKYLHISCLSQEVHHSSKQALNVGLKASKNDWIILTQPSVREFPAEWLSSFAEKINNRKKLVVGYSNVEPEKGAYNLFFRIESFLQQLKSFAYLCIGCGYVVEEDNVAFRRQQYFDMGGFAGEMNDEYMNLERLINKFIKKRQTALNLSGDGIIRKKQLITSKKYRELIIKILRIKKRLGFFRRFLLFVDSLTALLIIPVSLITLLLLPEAFIIVGAIVAVKAILRMLIIYNALNHLNEQKIFIPSLFYELIIPYVRLYFSLYYYRSLRKRKWDNN